MGSRVLQRTLGSQAVAVMLLDSSPRAALVPQSCPPRGVETLQTPTLLPRVLLCCLEPFPPPHPGHRVQEPPAPAEAVCPVGILTPGPSLIEELHSE